MYRRPCRRREYSLTAVAVDEVGRPQERDP